MSDNVHTPKHYQGRNGLEAIEVHRNFMNDEQLTGYHLGNLIKYVLRYRRKNGIEDLEKATLDALAKACTLIGGKNDQ